MLCYDITLEKYPRGRVEFTLVENIGVHLFKQFPLRTASGSLTNLSHVNEPPFINVQTPSLIRDRVIEPSFTLLSLCSLTRLEPRYRG